MRRGTTQEITFILPEEIAIDALYITFSQNNKTILEKTLDDVIIDGKNIIMPLDQEDTLVLSAPQAVYLQLRIRDTDGNALASKVLKVYAEDILKDGVI